MPRESKNTFTICKIIAPVGTPAIRLDLMPDVQNEPDEIILAPTDLLVTKVDKESDIIYIYDGEIKRCDMVKWIFFDVGSTLVDETEAYDHRVREMIAGTNITFKEFDDVRIALAQQGLDGNSAAIKHLGLTKTPWHSEDEVPYSDAHSTLSAPVAKGYKLGIIANQKLGTIERLESWGLRQYFDIIAASAELGYAKPDKEIFEKAFELAGCTAEESVMVGDRLDNDIIPAKAIGMKTVWVKNGLAQYQGAALDEGVVDYQIGSLSELLRIL